MAKTLLHVEGFSVLALCIYFYNYYEFSWLLFIIILFVPDLAIFGYSLSTEIGAIIYNIVHTYTIAIAIVCIGIITSEQMILAAGIIWTAHIGMDRMFGFGLKYPTNFKDTHFNRL